MEKQASQSWLTWAPESARPSRQLSWGRSQAIASGSSLARTDQKRVVEVLLERQVEHDVERGDASLRRDVDHLPVDQLGVPLRLGDRQRVEVERAGRHAACISSQVDARHTGSRYAAIRSSLGRSISFWNAVRMLSVNGSARFIWNTSGRHDTCGQTSMPRARAASCSSITLMWYGKPLIVSSAVHVNGRPISAWRSKTSVVA